MDLKSIINVKKIENNIHWLGMAAGALSDFGLSTPIVYAERALQEFHFPDLAQLKHHALNGNIGTSVKTGLVMAVGGAIGKRLLGGIGGRAAAMVEKWGSGQTIGGLIAATIVSTHFGGNPQTAIVSNNVLWGMS